MNGRIERLRRELDGLGAASFLVSHPVNVRYLTGVESSNALVLVKHKQVLVFTDGRYVEAVRGAVQEADGVEVVQLDRELNAALAPRLRELADAPFAFEADTVTFAAHEMLASGGVELIPATSVLRSLRAVKEDEELDAVRRAARILNEMFERFAGLKIVGRTEADVAWQIVQMLHEEGADDVSFDPIVGSGPNGARPHHHPGDRRIERDELVVVDAGAKLDGYYSDCTRTFATGDIPDDLRRAYSVCRDAQETALAQVKAGAGARDLDAVARREVETSGIAEVLHGLGHGVGLELQEMPVLRPTAESTLAPGNVITVEPGVYLPGRGGVRIEDLVIVHESGAEVLTPFTKDLLTLD
jgi:Xaa-Pro aminopeptidase